MPFHVVAHIHYASFIDDYELNMLCISLAARRYMEKQKHAWILRPDDDMFWFEAFQ